MVNLVDELHERFTDNFCDKVMEKVQEESVHIPVDIAEQLDDFGRLAYLSYLDFRKKQKRVIPRLSGMLAQLVSDRYFITWELTDAQAGYILACSNYIGDFVKTGVKSLCGIEIFTRQAWLSELGIVPDSNIYDFLLKIVPGDITCGFDCVDLFYGDLQKKVKSTPIDICMRQYLMASVFEGKQNLVLPDKNIIGKYIQEDLNLWSTLTLHILREKLGVKRFIETHRVYTEQLYENPYGPDKPLTKEQKENAEFLVRIVYHMCDREYPNDAEFNRRVYNSLDAIYTAMGMSLDALLGRYPDNKPRVLQLGTYWYLNFIKGE